MRKINTVHIPQKPPIMMEFTAKEATAIRHLMGCMSICDVHDTLTSEYKSEEDTIVKATDDLYCILKDEGYE